MRRNLPWLVALMILFAVLSSALAADEEDTATKSDAQAKKNQEKLIRSRRSFFGKLSKVEADKRVLTVEVTYKSLKPDPHAVQHLANLQVQLVQAQRNGNPVDRLVQINRIQLEIEKAQLNLYKDQKQKIELDAPDNMKVRTMLLPVEVDEKGRPRRLTEKERRELKGPDPKLPGYSADFDSLKADQTVEIYLVKQPKSKAKEKDKQADSTESSRPKIAMIVIRAEPQK